MNGYQPKKELKSEPPNKGSKYKDVPNKMRNFEKMEMPFLKSPPSEKMTLYHAKVVAWVADIPYILCVVCRCGR